MMQGNNSINAEDIGAKYAPVWVFVSYLYHTISHEQREHYHTSADFVPNITSLNVILYNNSVNKKLILLYFKHNIMCFCSITFKAIAELLRVSKQNSGV